MAAGAQREGRADGEAAASLPSLGIGGRAGCSAPVPAGALCNLGGIVLATKLLEVRLVLWCDLQPLQSHPALKLLLLPALSLPHPHSSPLCYLWSN